jgi:predicted nucleotidyltransferase
MIGRKEKDIIISCAQKFGAASVLLLDSAAEKDSGYRDIDLAVDGVRPEEFFKFYGELVRRLPRPVDVVDLLEDTPINRLVSAKGVKIYG